MGAHVHLPNQEELGWFRGEKRPDIVVDIIQGPRMGQAVLYDVTVTHPFQQIYRQKFLTACSLGEKLLCCWHYDVRCRAKFVCMEVSTGAVSYRSLGQENGYKKCMFQFLIVELCNLCNLCHDEEGHTSTGI